MVSTELTAELIDGPSACKPVSGPVSISAINNYWDRKTTSEISVSKQADDQYWKVVNVTSDAETEERLVRHLVMYLPYGAPGKQHPPEEKYFKC